MSYIDIEIEFYAYLTSYEKKTKQKKRKKEVIRERKKKY
jgi:hypothetical protein